MSAHFSADLLKLQKDNFQITTAKSFPCSPSSFEKTIKICFPNERLFSITTQKSNFMFDKQRSLQTIKKRLMLPHNWLEKTETTVVIKYYLEGRMKFMTLDRDDVPRLLKEAGMISRYEGSGTTRKMYCCEVPNVKAGNSFTSEWFENPVQCEEIKIYESDVIHFIACKEHDKIVNLMRYYQLN